MIKQPNELLRRALACLDAFYGVGGSFLADEIREYLATEEDNTIEIPRDIYVHLKNGRVTPSDLVEAVKKAKEGKGEYKIGTPYVMGDIKIHLHSKARGEE